MTSGQEIYYFIITNLKTKDFQMDTSSNPFQHLKQQLNCGENTYHYYNLKDLKDERLDNLPFSIRVLLESAIRNCDDFNIKRKCSVL